MQNAFNPTMKKFRAPQRTRSPDGREREISIIVGRNMKTLRAMTGMSQTALADKLGITFQQVQKYESGMNRVSAPKLVLMAEIFNTPISTFFANIETPEKEGQDTPAIPSFGKQGLRAARMVERMPPRIQGAALRVLRSLGEDE